MFLTLWVHSNIDLLIITSRRTSNEIKNLLNENLSSIAKIWLGIGKNPYELSLYNSHFFIITSDSTSMISEASISGMPIYVYQLPFKRKSVRFERFHSEFKKLNITRDFNSTQKLNYWNYDKAYKYFSKVDVKITSSNEKIKIDSRFHRKTTNNYFPSY